MFLRRAVMIFSKSSFLIFHIIFDIISNFIFDIKYSHRIFDIQ